MNLESYFKEKTGLGVLSTANGQGAVDAAIYSKPYFFEDGTVGFLMADKLSHANLKENPLAHYLFKEEGPKFKGKRLSLKKVGESEDPKLIEDVIKKHFSSSIDGHTNPKQTFLVIFSIEQELPLVGTVIGEQKKAFM